MGKIQKNEKGFSAIEVMLVIVVLAVIGVAGYFVAKHVDTKKTVAVIPASTKSTTTTKTTATTPTETASSYEGWQTYQLPVEKLMFKYPPSDYSINPANYSDVSQHTSYDDTAVLTGLNTLIFIEAVTNPGGINATQNYSPVPEYSIPASLAGQNGYINFFGSGFSSTSPISVIAFNTAKNDYSFPTAKNISSPNSKYKTLSVYLTLGSTSNGPYQPLSTVLKSQYYNDFKLILASMSY